MRFALPTALLGALSFSLATLAHAEEDRLVLAGRSYGKNALAICDAKGEVGWEFDQWDLVGNGLACWQVPDPKQPAMVRQKRKKT